MWNAKKRENDHNLVNLNEGNIKMLSYEKCGAKGGYGFLLTTKVTYLY